MKTLAITALALALPLAANAAEPQGEFIQAYAVSVDASGRVERIVPQGGLDGAVADQVAAQVRQWTFEPARGTPAGPASTYLRVLARAEGNGVRILDASTGPRPVALTAPTYPQADQRRGREGVVVLQLDLDAQGAVTASRVHATSGDVSRGMGEAALRASNGWRFEPERLGGQAVAASILLPVCFASDPGEAMCQWTSPDAQRRGSREVVSLAPVLRPVGAAALLAGR